MRKFSSTVLAIVGSWLGWWLGNQVGIWFALLLSSIGCGAGLYFGRRLTQF